MSFSITRAAKETGLSKSTISRAVKAGKISAARQDDGSYLIDPAELFRAYPRMVAQPTSDAPHDALRNPHEQRDATASHDAEILRVKLEMTEAMLAREQETVADLRRRLDVATERVLSLTKVAQPHDDAANEAVRTPLQQEGGSGFWRWLRGR